jgi:hypothetical protein
MRQINLFDIYSVSNSIFIRVFHVCINLSLIATGVGPGPGAQPLHVMRLREQTMDLSK